MLMHFLAHKSELQMKTFLFTFALAATESESVGSEVVEHLKRCIRI